MFFFTHVQECVCVRVLVLVCLCRALNNWWIQIISYCSVKCMYVFVYQPLCSAGTPPTIEVAATTTRKKNRRK